jgi:hypothetical protein
MAKRLSSWLRQAVTGWVALAALVIFVLFSALVLPGQSAQSERSGAEDVGSPDLSLYYSPAELYRMAEAYGEEGRSEYVRARFTFDLIWPVVYALFLTTALAWLFGRAFPAGSRWQLASLMPILGLLFDYLENIATSVVMLRYPAETAVVDALAPIFTLLKWLLLGISFLLLVLGAGALLWRRLRRS